MDDFPDGTILAFAMFLLANKEIVGSDFKIQDLESRFGKTLHFATLQGFTVKTVILTADTVFNLIDACRAKLQTLFGENCYGNLDQIQEVLAKAIASRGGYAGFSVQESAPAQPDPLSYPSQGQW